MALIIDGITFADGEPLLVGGIQAQSVQVIKDGNPPVEVWVNNYVADTPTAFTASDALTANIDFTWVLPVDQGVPTCTYEVIDTLGAVVASAGVGATSATFVTTVSTSDTFYVRAINIAGASPSSNGDVGSSYIGAASPLTITSTGTYTAGVDFPANTDITLCMVGGGGSGALSGTHAGGGYAGAVVSQAVNIPAGDITMTIGGGAGRQTAFYGGGHTGGTSSVGSLVSAAGGGGGSNGGTSYAGNSGSRSTCGGTNTDGRREVYGAFYGYGGQSSGFGNGGAGSHTLYTGGNGGTGSGGGGVAYGLYGSGGSGAGGRGEIRLSW